MFCQCTSVGRIRHSSDPLDLSRLGQLHRPYGPADRTREDHLSTSTGRHAPFHHLGEQHNQQGESSRLEAAAEFLTMLFLGDCDFTFSSSPSPSMPNFLISGTAVVFSTSTFRRQDNAVQCRNKLKTPELDESHRRNSCTSHTVGSQGSLVTPLSVAFRGLFMNGASMSRASR